MTFALGLIAGYGLYRFLHRHADIEAEAFIAGYLEGHYDGETHRPRQWNSWESAKWRRENPPDGEIELSYDGPPS